MICMLLQTHGWVCCPISCNFLFNTLICQKKKPVQLLHQEAAWWMWHNCQQWSPTCGKCYERVFESFQVRLGPVDSSLDVSPWGPGTGSSGSSLQSEALPGRWCSGNQTCWRAALWPPEAPTECRRLPLMEKRKQWEYFTCVYDSVLGTL